jgi:signal transduction histidine kinase
VVEARALAQKADYQRYRGSQELVARSKNVDQQIKGSAGLPLDAPVELLCPVWLGEDLVLARRTGDGILVVALDWPQLKHRLESDVADLFPSARLERSSDDNDERLLASLPVRLWPGPLAGPVPAGPSVLFGLGLAWASVLLAVAAVVALLLGAVALSERRAVFVSAVTHELRTPLTTFRTYTEMLSRGMVPEGARAEYLETLRREADRLAHLTENVLLYARLERGRGGHRIEEVDLPALLERVRPRLEGRASRPAWCWWWRGPRRGWPATPRPSSRSSSTSWTTPASTRRRRRRRRSGCRCAPGSR